MMDEEDREVCIRIDRETSPSLWYIGTYGITRRLDLPFEEAPIQDMGLREEGIVKALLTYAQGHFTLKDE